MPALTLIIRSPDGNHLLSEGQLFRHPPELIDAARCAKYLQLDKPGWFATEFGYHTFVKTHDSGDLYIFPALIIAGEKIKRKRFIGYNVEFTKKQIESYAEGIISIGSKVQDQLNSEFNLLVHDLRQLSTSIYHSAEEGLRLLSERNFTGVEQRLENIVGAQSMLKIRTDVLDYAGNPGDFGEFDYIPIYRRVDKVVKSFTSIAAKKGIRIFKEGSSFSEAYGPNAFEVIAYIIVDNAIKYSPRNTDISVKFLEAGESIKIQFSSVGPIIDGDEKKAIFKRGVRGRHAILSGSPGSGVGLSLAERLVKQFKGQIEVSISDSEFIIDGTRMTDVCFSIDVPISTPVPDRNRR